ncbi:MAG: DUF285 domain-containing protein, partial [Lachnospiraceae bacterium]|nr:DUF285 domain-containing protein [Lachnospiraceae bacterium]
SRSVTFARLDAEGTPGYFERYSKVYVVINTQTGAMYFRSYSVAETDTVKSFTLETNKYYGAPDDPDESHRIPWADYMDEVTSVTFEVDLMPTYTDNWFNGCSNLRKINLEMVLTDSLTGTSNMFKDCRSLKTIYVAEGYSMANITGNDEGMFSGCVSLVGGDETAYSDVINTDSANADRKKYAIVDDKTTDPDNPQYGYFTCKVYVDFKDGVLTFSATMPDDDRWYKPFAGNDLYEAPENVLWYTYHDEIEKVEFKTAIKAKKAAYWFANCTALKEIVNMDQYLETQDATTMKGLFYGCTKLPSNGDTGLSKAISKLNTSNVENMSYMFYDCDAITELDLSTFDTAKVTDMSYMFNSDGKLEYLNVEGFDTSNVTHMERMFGYCGKLKGKNSDIQVLDLSGSGWKTEKVEKMYGMFRDCLVLPAIKFGDGWNVSKVSGTGYTEQNGFKYMFNNCDGLTSLDLSPWSWSQVDGKATSAQTAYGNMFQSCNKLESIEFGDDFYTGNASGGYAMYQMFKDSVALKELDLSMFDTTKVTRVYETFYNCQALETIKFGPKWTMAAIKYEDDMVRTFRDCLKLKNLLTVDEDGNDTGKGVSEWDVSNIQNMAQAFYNCESLESLDVSQWDTGNVMNMSHMFAQCDNLKYVMSVSASEIKFNPKKVSQGYNMFDGCKSLKSEGINVSNWNTGNIQNFTNMFANCSSLVSLDVGDWDISGSTLLTNMFYGCSLLTDFGEDNLATWDTSHITDMKGLFQSCATVSSIDMSGWDISSVTKMENMFASCVKLNELDLSGYDTKSLVNTKGMFDSCSELKTIFASELFTKDQITDSTDMFKGCDVLVGGNGTSFADKNTTDKTYALIDKEGQEGYFTEQFVAYLEGNTLVFASSYPAGIPDDCKWNVDKVYTTAPGWSDKADEITTVRFRTIQHPISTAYWFYGLDHLTGFEEFDKLDILNVTDMNHMFYGCSALEELDIQLWKTGQVEDMSHMFEDCTSLKTIYAYSGNFLTDQLASGKDEDMFNNCTVLEGSNGTKYAEKLVKDKSYAWTDGWITKDGEGTETEHPGYFTDTVYAYMDGEDTLRFAIHVPESIPDNMKWKVGEATTYTATAQNKGWRPYRTNIITVVFDNYVTPDNTAFWFAGCTNLVIVKDIERLNTSRVTDMQYMFDNCSSDAFVTLDVSHFDTAKVENMSHLFNYCNRPLEFDVSNWNTAKVTKMDYLFACPNNKPRVTTLDLSSWETSNVTTMERMFSGRTSLKTLLVDDEKFDSSNVTSMSYMFQGLYSCTREDFGFLETGSVTNMSGMFNYYAWGSGATQLDLHHFDTSNVTNMSNMFLNAKRLTSLNVSGWDVRKVTSMYQMFACTYEGFPSFRMSLTNLDLTGWQVRDVTNMSKMFF